MGCKKATILLICWIVYLCLGAVAFIVLEEGFHSTGKPQSQKHFSEVFRDFAREHSSCGVNRENLLSFMREHGQAAQTKGVFRFDADPLKGVRDEWSMANALVFASEIVTTIGNGTLTPRTFRGRLVCIVYTLVGVPLCYFMLAAVGDASLIVADKIDQVLRRIRSLVLLNVVRLSIIVLIVWMILVTIPTLIYANTEGWTWLAAQYFSFTEMSTIGFGELTRSLHRYRDSTLLDWCYKGGATVYCFLALCVVSTVFKVLFRWHRNHIKQIRNKFRSWNRRASFIVKRRNNRLAVSNVGENREGHHATNLD